MNDSMIEYILYSYNTTIYFLILGVLFSIYALNRRNLNSQSQINYLLFSLITLFLIWRIGCQPIGLGTGGDRDNYARTFEEIKTFGRSEVDFDEHDQLMRYFAFIFPSEDVELYFIIVATIYVGFYAISCLKLLKESAVWLLVTIILSFGFLSYGINTMRAGLAFSLIFFGIANHKSLPISCLFYLSAVLTHFSTLLPVSFLILTRFINFKNTVILFWSLCVLVSFISGNYFNTIFSSLFEEERTSYLLSTGEIYNAGFRLDFILYSLVPLIIGWFYIFKRNYNSGFYKSIYNAYVLTNGFWILVIRADFSDRFAYLSWFLIPFILVYPILKDQTVVRKPNRWLSLILIGETAFLSLFIF